MRRPLLALSLAALLTACGGEDPAPAPAVDAGALVDAGADPSDAAAAADATEPSDTGVTAPDAAADASAADAGPDPDAEAADLGPDGGGADARPADAEPADLGPDDAGADAAAATDAGAADAADLGVLDGGPVDAGAATDAGALDGAVGRDAGGPCARSADCNPDERCGRVRVVNNAVVTLCGPPNPPPAGPVGTSCSGDMQCADGLCLDDVVGECAVGCGDDADCPSGFTCVGYRYDPGAVIVQACTRACRRDGDCSASRVGNVCNTQSWTAPGGASRFTLACSLPLGPEPIGGACSSGADCASALCLTTRRGSCTSSAACGLGQACLCANGQPPPCAGGAGASCTSAECTAPCRTASDCVSPLPTNALTTCSSSVSFRLPDGSSVPVLVCTRP